ncbi:MAG: hypothetical protein HYV15_00555, partial [Elusimicrobia bacterium]|nr:hypothetical protein [Elusimicrobiota bacterium]
MVIISGIVALILPLASAQEAPPSRPSTQAQFQRAMAALAKSSDDKTLRERVVKLGARLRPAIPKEAQKAAVRGGAFLGTDASDDEVRKAAQEFQKAVDAAPWWPEAYYNLAMAEER